MSLKPKQNNIERLLGSIFTSIFLAILISLIAISLLSRTTARIDGFTLSLSASPWLTGITEINLPPFGSLTAYSHKTPIKLKLTVERLSFTGIKKIATSQETGSQLLASLDNKAKPYLLAFLFKIVAIFVFFSLLVVLILPKKSLTKFTVTLSLSLLTIAILIIATTSTYNFSSFRQPRYSGMLSAAPWLTGVVEEKLSDLETFRTQVTTLANNFSNFYKKIENLKPTFSLDGKAIRLLHVSDIHDNPAAIDLISKVVKEFKVDLVVDTGDITDYGTPIEASIVTRLQKIKVPYLFIPGNHDSPEVIQHLRQIKNITVLDQGETITVYGITILGFPDPISKTIDSHRSQTKTQEEIYARQLVKIYNHQQPVPDIVAVHEPANANKLIGKSKLILFGHTHRASVQEKNGTILINAGSTGAAGIRGFQKTSGLPFTLKLLYIKPKSMKVLAVDSLSIQGLQLEAGLQRTVFTKKQTQKTKPKVKVQSVL